jgi:putative DNA methylase
MAIPRKKLIEVALPLEAINVASAKEKSIRHGHPSTLHLWWARRPLAACRAILFAQLVDDPSAWPERFPTGGAEHRARTAASGNQGYGAVERLERRGDPRPGALGDRPLDRVGPRRRTTSGQRPPGRHRLPATPRTAGLRPVLRRRLDPARSPAPGLRAIGSDLNPVAVLISKATVEVPPKFTGRAPVNPEARSRPDLIGREWRGAQGLARTCAITAAGCGARPSAASVTYTQRHGYPTVTRRPSSPGFGLALSAPLIPPRMGHMFHFCRPSCSQLARSMHD